MQEALQDDRRQNARSQKCVLLPFNDMVAASPGSCRGVNVARFQTTWGLFGTMMLAVTHQSSDESAEIKDRNRAIMGMMSDVKIDVPK